MPRTVVLCLLLLVASAPDAAAEWHFAPMAGLTMFGSTSVIDPEQGTGKVHLNAGGAVSWLSKGIFGIEGLTTWTPNFFDGDPNDFLLDPGNRPVEIESSRALSFMTNVVVTLPQRYTEYGLRPFISGGLGWMHLRSIDNPEIFPVNVNVLGMNIGGGAVGFLTERTGLRFDVRYHSTLNQLDEANALTDAYLRYITASVGIVIRR